MRKAKRCSARAGTDRTRFAAAVATMMGREFTGHRYVLGHHDDKGHVHVHAILLARNADGTKIDPEIADLARRREAMAQAAREHGVAMVATRRHELAAGRPFTRAHAALTDRGLASEAIRTPVNVKRTAARISWKSTPAGFDLARGVARTGPRPRPARPGLGTGSPGDRACCIGHGRELPCAFQAGLRKGRFARGRKSGRAHVPDRFVDSSRGLWRPKRPPTCAGPSLNFRARSPICAAPCPAWRARRKKPIDRVLDALVNTLSIIYAHFYFPTYSNGLKEVGGCLGCSWSDEKASGIPEHRVADALGQGERDYGQSDPCPHSDLPHLPCPPVAGRPRASRLRLAEEVSWRR